VDLISLQPNKELHEILTSALDVGKLLASCTDHVTVRNNVFSFDIHLAGGREDPGTFLKLYNLCRELDHDVGRPSSS
jgi:hypothetical protein